MAANNCSCCEGLTAVTPVAVTNRAGLEAIVYRVGTQALFKETLLARLSTSKQPALYGLTTRNDDDFTIALLDAFATMADVLTFYQERIANESYLGTATELVSVLQLARLVGYELQPGVAATAAMAFALDTSSAALGPLLLNNFTQNAQVPLPPVTIPVGTQIQSIPSPGAQAQTFETIEAIVAQAEWNAIPPQLSTPQVVSTAATSFLFTGTSNNLNKGDVLLIVDSSNHSVVRKIQSVTLNSAANTTSVQLVPVSAAAGAAPAAGAMDMTAGSGSMAAGTTSMAAERNLARASALFTAAPPVAIEKKTTVAEGVQSLQNQSLNQQDLTTLLRIQNWSPKIFTQYWKYQLTLPVFNAVAGVYVFRQRASVFGYNAPEQINYPASPPSQQSTEWTAAESPTQIFLDNGYPQILPGSYIAVQQQGVPIDQSMTIALTGADVTVRQAYGINAKTTLLSFAAASWYPPGSTFTTIRGITVYAQNEALPLANLPVTVDVQGSYVTLNSLYQDLQVGQQVILTGTMTNTPGVPNSELMTIQQAVTVNGYTQLTFVKPLANTYDPTTVYINANIAMATHGQSVSEILGSGDATQTFQEFQLKQSPLTYISANTPTGIQSTLTVTVNGVAWSEVPSFYGHGPQETIFITREDDAHLTTVVFGDGQTGSRLPTGQNNIKAAYRIGIGTPGMVAAGQLTQLMNRPAGVKSVNNPLGAFGAVDPEITADARVDATQNIYTLERVVSLEDYADFAAAYPGVSKTLATWTWSGQKRWVYLTIAGANQAPVDPVADAQLYTNLTTQILAAGDPDVPLTIVTYQPLFFTVGGNLVLDPAYDPDAVQAAINAALQNAFSFDSRAFGQSVAYSEVVAVIQPVAGVIAVDINAFYLTTGAVPGAPLILTSAPTTTSVPPPVLFAAGPTPGAGGVVSQAQLLTIDPRPIQFNVVS